MVEHAAWLVLPQPLGVPSFVVLEGGNHRLLATFVLVERGPSHLVPSVFGQSLERYLMMHLAEDEQRRLAVYVPPSGTDPIRFSPLLVFLGCLELANRRQSSNDVESISDRYSRAKLSRTICGFNVVTN